MEEGELPGGESPAGRAGTRPKSASMTPAKRTAACLGEFGGWHQHCFEPLF